MQIQRYKCDLFFFEYHISANFLIWSTCEIEWIVNLNDDRMKYCEFLIAFLNLSSVRLCFIIKVSWRNCQIAWWWVSFSPSRFICCWDKKDEIDANIRCLIISKYLRWAIVVAMLTTLFSVILILVGMSLDYDACQSVAYTPPFQFGNLILSLGTFMFGFGGHAVFPTIQHDMKNPGHFTYSAILAFCSLFFVLFIVNILFSHNHRIQIAVISNTTQYHSVIVP